MTHHVSIPVKDLEKSGIYYDKTLSCLGYQRIYTGETETLNGIGYSRKEKPEFWLVQRKDYIDNDKQGQFLNTPGLHIAFASLDKKGVDDWYKKCVELGAKDNGAPGSRYHGSYSAYIIDPNGWHTEAMCDISE